MCPVHVTTEHAGHECWGGYRQVGERWAVRGARWGCSVPPRNDTRNAQSTQLKNWDVLPIACAEWLLVLSSGLLLQAGMDAASGSACQAGSTVRGPPGDCHGGALTRRGADMGAAEAVCRHIWLARLEVPACKLQCQVLYGSGQGSLRLTHRWCARFPGFWYSTLRCVPKHHARPCTLFRPPVLLPPFVEQLSTPFCGIAACGRPLGE